ncbi:MAG TPA: hypothetical protein VFQ60_02520 [Patescibacteria group bacterium]|nr:hypothetical protein [Patescibacteria group bacterium]
MGTAQGKGAGRWLTTEMVERFKGGQMEIQNSDDGYLYRGEIETIVVEENELRVKFAWLAKGEGFPPIPRKWVKDDRLDYTASLEIYAASDIGPSGHDVGGDSRICLSSFMAGETVILYPPNGSKLDPAKVEGLHI